MPAEAPDVAARGVPLPSLGSLYSIVLSVAILGAMASQVFAVELPGLLRTGPEHHGGTGLVFGFSLGLALAAAGGVLGALIATGPVGMTRAALTWCLGTPRLSARLHRRAFWSRAAAAGVIAGVAGLTSVLVAWSSLAPGQRSAAVTGGILAGVLAGVAAAALATGGQVRAGAREGARRVAVLLFAAGLLVWYLASFDVVNLGAAGASAAAAAGLAVVVLPGLALAPAAVRALTRGSIPLEELLRSGDAVDRLTAATVMLSARPLKRPPSSRRGFGLGALPARARTRPAWIALVDARRTIARPGVLLAAAVLVPMTASLTRLAGASAGCLVLTVLAFGLARRVAGWYRGWLSTPGLRALLPFEGRAATLVLLAAPALVAAVFALASVVVAGLPGWWVVTATLAALVGVHREAAAERREGDAGALLVATPAGGIPVFVVLRLLAGWDVAVIAGLLAFVLPAFSVLEAVAVVAGFLLWRSSAPPK